MIITCSVPERVTGHRFDDTSVEKCAIVWKPTLLFYNRMKILPIHWEKYVMNSGDYVEIRGMFVFVTKVFKNLSLSPASQMFQQIHLRVWSYIKNSYGF